MELSVIIPTYNGRKLLENNLPSLFKELQSVKNSEVIVVDNNSSDGTEEYLHKLPNVQYYRHDKNKGFSGAVNTGASHARGKYLLILNNDCILKEKSILKLFNFLNDHEEFIATQPIVYKQETDIENIGYVLDLRKAKAREIRDISYNFLDQNNNIFASHSVFGLSAACLLISKDIFKKIGMFDESFHSYLEDVDLFIRLARNGYKYAPCLNASAVHVHMSTSRKMKGYKEWHDLTNWIRIIKKNYPASYILRNLLPLCIERLRNLKGYLSVIVG